MDNREPIFSPMALLNLGIIFISSFILMSWAKLSGFSFDVASIYGLGSMIAVLLLIAIVYGYFFKVGQITSFFIWFAIFFSFSSLTAMFGYLANSLSNPLIDEGLMLADLAVGLDWVSYVNWIAASPLLAKASNLTYTVSSALLLYVMTFLIISKEVKRLEVLVTTLGITAVFTIVLCGLYPAVGPFFHTDIQVSTFKVLPTIMLEGPSQYYEVMKGLREGTVTSLSWENIKGVVEFPSFHTVLSVIMILAMRGFGVMFVIFLVINVFVLLSIPFSGGHYFMDVFAGIGLTVLSWKIATDIQLFLEKYKGWRLEWTVRQGITG